MNIIKPFLLSLTNIVTLLETLALATRGVDVGEALALLLLGEGRGLVGAGDVVSDLGTLVGMLIDVLGRGVRGRTLSGTPWPMFWLASMGPLSEEPSPLRGMLIDLSWWFLGIV